MVKPKTPAEYLKLPYTHTIVRDEDTGTFTAQIMELPGCIAQGDSPEGAYARLEDVAKEWISIALEQGESIPKPFQTHGFSGRFALRLPRTLHQQAALLADVEGTSLNKLIVSALSERVGVATFSDKLARRLAESAQRSIHIVTNVSSASTNENPDVRVTPTGDMEVRH